jgi:NAD(P)-dependent dehydrogenase (short-subunit alcohol dehydrogenase family)
MDVKDKVIIVTGASGGIGLATAKLLARAGAKVALAARSKEILDDVAQELPGSIPIETDMSIPESVGRMIDETKKHYGRIDILINNAGRGMYGAVENTDIAAFRYVIDLNLMGPLVAMQKVIPIMREQGGGMIVNVGSLVSKSYFPFLGPYASTKYALNAVSLTARAELQKDGIIVSVVHPGMTDTNFGRNAIKSDSVARGMESRRREGMPEPDSPEYVAGRILLAIETEQAEVYAHDRPA